MSKPYPLRIFLSSPSDVAEERALALEIIDELMHDPLWKNLVQLEAVAWDKRGSSTPFLATSTPQDAINEGLPKPSDCDIVVVIFWARMGTPLPENYRKADGTRYLSGTEWEYDDAMQAARQSGRPEVIVYHRGEEVAFKPTDPDFMSKYAQWQHVQDFFATFINPDGSIGQGYNRYQDPADFADQLRQHLRHLMKRVLDKQGLLLTAPDDMLSPPLDANDKRLLRQLADAALVWEQHQHSPDFLWKGKQLQNALALVERLQAWLSPLEIEFLTPEDARLLAEINNPALNHHRRLTIGERLNEIGDTRTGIGLNEDGWPDIAWCAVEAGQVYLSDDDGLAFDVQPFYIARYPISYRQFQAFIEDDYANPQWWEGLGSHKDVPTQPRPFDNHPVEQVSWYDAMAFCRWLSQRLGYAVRLPTEWEWQHAAGATHYPWGDEWDELASNGRHSNLLRATALGMYPAGASAVGALDMIGNVWEWCLNEHETPTQIEFRGSKKRALRGCSYLSRKHKAHTLYRAGNVPNYRHEAHGFRICTQDFAK